MSKVISKIRCYNPSFKNTPQGNKNHLYYIARRNMAIANEKGVSTFGEIDGINVQEAHLKEIAKEINRKSLERTNIYRGIISLKELDALKLGYDKQSNWNELMQRQVYDIAKELGISPLNTQWVAVVHLKKGNPHLHYMLWDKDQKINSCFITTKQQCKVRELLTKDIFEDELQEYYDIQNDIKSKFRSNAIALEIKSFDKGACIGKIAYINYSNSELKEIMKRFKDIKQSVSDSGRLAYKLMPKDIKQKIDEFVKLFLDINVDFKNEYEKYIKTAGNIGKCYSGNSKKYYENKAKKELNTILGNQLLNSIKMINYEKKQEKIIAKNLLQELFRFLSILNDSNEAKLNLYSNYRGEMSKQAKKDFARSKSNASSINWEQ